ncbi:hypothetical protein ACL03H_15550 [Saccharopolyspora sp. MS10]|uniref:hypothetical protein n=1 Tax=Saccharopolyspora sp. MS10 TaxID=3385973 RepID=UPI0039A16563
MSHYRFLDRDTSGAATCAAPRCTAPRPEDATARWRFCSTACRQASYRARHRDERIDTEVAVQALDEEVAEALRALLDTVLRGHGELADPAQPKTGAVAELVARAQRVTDAAVARDRAAGISWADISTALGVTFATARRRYGPRTAENLTRFRTSDRQDAAS